MRRWFILILEESNRLKGEAVGEKMLSIFKGMYISAGAPQPKRWLKCCRGFN